MDKTIPHIITTDKDIKVCVNELVAQCPHMKSVFETVGMPPLRIRNGGFEGVARIVVGQQLSVASANSIWNRFFDKLGDISVQRFREMSEDDLRACGLSRPKIKTLNAVCVAVESGDLNFAAFEGMDYPDIVKVLTGVSGIGPWTADVYVMFCLGHPDAWAPGDLALQYAVQDVLSLDEKPSVKEMTVHAERWQPWRGVAARLLWAYYSVMKQSKSGVPV